MRGPPARIRKGITGFSWEGKALPDPPAGGGMGKPGFPIPLLEGGGVGKPGFPTTLLQQPMFTLAHAAPQLPSHPPLLEGGAGLTSPSGGRAGEGAVTLPALPGEL